MPDTVCSFATFTELVQPLVGLTVALPWKGYGTSLFLELGKLTPVESGRRRRPAGEASIFIEWDWRAEHASSVLYGSANTGPKIERGLAGLQDVAIESLSVAGDVPELAVSFSNGHCLRSMVVITGDPAWSIRLPDGRSIFVRAGKLRLGNNAGSLSEEEAAAFALAERTAERWGTPLADPVQGQCRDCAGFVAIDGEGHLLDYGVCILSDSPFDGRAVNCASGCPAHVAQT